MLDLDLAQSVAPVDLVLPIAWLTRSRAWCVPCRLCPKRLKSAPWLVFYSFKFVFKEPSSRFVVKLYHNTHTATICHSEVFDGADLTEFVNQDRGYSISKAVYFNFLTDLHLHSDTINHHSV